MLSCIVVAVSQNTNSFGLRGMVIMSSDGEMWEVLASYLDVKPKGAVLSIPEDRDIPTQMVHLGFECPRRLNPDASAIPAAKVKRLWKQVLKEAGSKR